MSNCTLSPVIKKCEVPFNWLDLLPDTEMKFWAWFVIQKKADGELLPLESGHSLGYENFDVDQQRRAIKFNISRLRSWHRKKEGKEKAHIYMDYEIKMQRN